MYGTDLILVTIGVVVSFGMLAFFYFVRREIRQLKEFGNNDQSMSMLNQNIVGMQQRMDTTTNAINQRLDRAASYISQLSKEAGAMSEIGRSIKDFQDYINSPKIRGNLGEQILGEALKQVFADNQYSIQHRFNDGQIVDALIHSSSGTIPIDAKFPLEDYRRMVDAESLELRKGFLKDFERAVKKHIDDIAKKYILPHEGTMDFAVMYVPSEGVYYEIVAESADIMQHARERRVLLVSPNTFFQFLRVILMGMERTKLTEETKRIWELLRGIQQDAGKFNESFMLVSKHLTNAKHAVDTATNEYGRLAGKIDQVKVLQ